MDLAPGTSSIAVQEVSRVRWERTLQLNQHRLGKHINLIEQNLDFTTFDIYLRHLESKCTAHGLGKLALRSQTFLDQVRQFTSAINALTQSHPITCFLWGGLQCVLELAYSFNTILSSITEMLQDLTKRLPLFEEYRSLFPKAHELEEPLRELYDDYVNFCINVILFFKSSKWGLLGKLVWRKVKNDFERSKTSVEKHSVQFQDRVNLARARLGVSTNEHVIHLTSLSESGSRKQTIVKGIPFPRNPKFQARDSVLRDLHENLKPIGLPLALQQRSCVIHGMGGIGKTQLALEYTYRYRDSYAYIFWIRSETGPEIADSFGAIAREFMPAAAGRDQKRDVELVREWLVKTQSWLVVFDNANDEDLSRYWPPSIHGSIIVTTQRQIMTHRATSAIQLEPFEDTDGSTLILSYLTSGEKDSSSETRDLAKSVSVELGGLPLLLSHIAGFVDESKCPLSDLLESLQQPSSFKTIWAFDSSLSTNFQYGEPMRKVWQLALQALTPNALATLQLLAMLGTDGVLEELMIGEWADPDLQFLKPEQRFDFNQTRRSLIDHHLVSSSSFGGQPSLSIHRTLGKHMLQLMNEDMDPNRLQTVFQRALAIVRSAFPSQSELQAPTNNTWQSCQRCLSHVLSLQNIYDTWNKNKSKIAASIDFVTLLSDAANHLWERGFLNDGIRTLEIVEPVCDDLWADDTVLTVHANICAVAGAMLAESGFSNRALAIQKCQKALELRKNRIESRERSGTVGLVDAMLLANGWNDIGVVAIQNAEYEVASSYFEEALKIKRTWSSEESHPQQFGETYKNMPFWLLRQGRTKEAQLISRRALNLLSRENSEKSAATQKGKFVLACILLLSNNPKEALRLHKDVLEVRTEIFGELHHLCKDSKYMIGEIYRLTGKLVKAEKTFRETLENSELSQVSEECVARTKYHLSLVIRALEQEAINDRTREADRLAEEAKLVRFKFLELLSEERRAEDEIRIHDFLVSIWSGRTTGVLLHNDIYTSPSPDAITSQGIQKVVPLGAERPIHTD